MQVNEHGDVSCRFKIRDMGRVRGIAGMGRIKSKGLEKYGTVSGTITAHYQPSHGQLTL